MSETVLTLETVLMSEAVLMQSGSERELKVVPRWFEVTEVADGVFRITEPYVHAYVRSNSWLVRGRDSHLLVDSGLGIGRLPGELAG